MKDWIKKIDGQDISDAYDNIDIQYKTESELDKKILAKIREKNYWEVTGNRRSLLLRRFLLAAAIFVIVLVPLTYIYNTFFNLHKIVLTHVSAGVDIKKNNVSVLLSPGSVLNKKCGITTGTNSSCSFRYAHKSFVTINEQTEMTIEDFTQVRILLRIFNGKIDVKENDKKGADIYVKIPSANIYAIGTEFSVYYSKAYERTIITVKDGIVQVEIIGRKENIEVNAGEELILIRNEVPVKGEIGTISGYGREWSKKIIVPQSSGQESIIGFYNSGKYLVAVTEQSLLCLLQDVVLWQYNPDQSSFFSLPGIYHDRIYVSSRDSLYCFDLKTGIIIHQTRHRDTMKPGHMLVQYKNIGYLVFASGIYLYDWNTGSISPDPLIPVIDAAIPAFYDKEIYITSYVMKNLSAYSISGEIIWSIQFSDNSSCSPVIVNHSILSGTKNGKLYKTAFEGRIENEINIGDSILSILHDIGNAVFIHTVNNKLYEVNSQSMKITTVYNNVKKGLVSNNTLFLGMPDNSIKIINLVTEEENILELPHSAVNSLAGTKNAVYAGLEDGSIIKLENK